ncbi:hypothetical protein Pmani_008935 [Petrolisthes manimaculis]|uniref:Uncharacterized protein n=1 Tax=Petrolisthes manimaculis TaxID=1843537 RepID=A0AAE1Q5T7_9EUCA|nr:hypothetical protein Pmani_008935 [Petrolisthes manimaculis]
MTARNHNQQQQVHHTKNMPAGAMLQHCCSSKPTGSMRHGSPTAPRKKIEVWKEISEVLQGRVIYECVKKMYNEGPEVDNTCLEVYNECPKVFDECVKMIYKCANVFDECLKVS